MGDVLRVLLVEDQQVDAVMVQGLVAAAEPGAFVFTHVATLGAALERLRAETFDAVLLDLHLPDSTGPETFETLHAAHAGQMVVVLTGMADDKLALRAIARGAEDYLVKAEVSGAAIARVLRRAVERHRLIVERERLLGDLQRALAEVERLSGLLNVCAWCKKIEAEHGRWVQMEAYIREHSEADFSHSICPDCKAKLDAES